MSERPWSDSLDLPRRLFVVQVVLALALAPWYPAAGLWVDWWTAWPLLAAHAALGAAWWRVRRRAARSPDSMAGDVLLATLLLVLLTNIVSPAQYVAVAWRRPLIDAWLVRADAALGIDVAALAGWTAAHPRLSLALSACYASLLPQFLLPILIVGLRHRDRQGLWEYLFHFHFCLIGTLAALALFPAECAFTALRAGTFHRLDFGNLEGLISMPSFHAAGACMVMWAFRRHRRMRLVLGVVNVGLVAATVMSGAHYAVDVLASGLLFAASVGSYRLLSRRRAAAPTPVRVPAGYPPPWPAAARTSTR